MSPVFLDTSFVLALEDADDQYHRQALAYWRGFQKRPQPLVITSFVFDETLTLVRRRLGHAQAKAIARRLLVSPSVVVVHVGEEDFRAGLEWFDRYDDKDFSFTDCVSFAVMRRLKLKVALTFDQHFKQAGFQPKP